MSYNLTEKQKQLARWLIGKIRDEKMAETFVMSGDNSGKIHIDAVGVLEGREGKFDLEEFDVGTFNALEADRLLLQETRMALDQNFDGIFDEG